jgi:hypothetical protein
MENKRSEISHGMEKASQSMEKAVETMGDTVIAILDKLAGKKTDLKLSFEDLTLDVGMMKVKLNGAVVLDIQYATEVKP